MRPVVGITSYAEEARWGVWELPAALIPLSYVRAVENAGGRPLLVPPCAGGVDETLDALDGLIFSGGADLDPESYGAEAHPETNGTRPDRDSAELALLEGALARDMPVLAVCRGSQVLNVARGGDLVQHLPEVVGHEGHKHTPGVFADHGVEILPGTRLSGVVGEHAPVKSHHHQGYGRLGRGIARGRARRRRHRRGDRGSDAPLCPRRPLAPGGGRGRGALRGARRRSEALPGGTRMITVLNPATEKPIVELPEPGVEETDAAVARAKAAFPAWRAVAPSDRARLLRRLATLVEEHGEELARIESQNVGKPIAGARGEIGMVAEVFHFYAGAVDKHHGETIPVAGGVDLTFREPLGVVGLIVPWNFPLNISSWKLGPALACGNTVVLKPAELTPLSALRLAELVLEAGIPEGVVNVVAGKGSIVGQRMVEHPDVAKIGFTGSTEVGRRVMEGAAATIKRVTLELGGKSANVVFADADLEKAAAAAPYAVFDNAGQDCCARSRILVERSAYDRFLELLVEATRGVKVGDPAERGDRDGPADLGRPPRDGLVLRRRGRGVPGRNTGRPRLLVPVHARRGDERRPGRPRGGLRPRRGRDPVRGRGGRAAPRQRHALRPFGLHLDARRRASPPHGARHRLRRPLGELEQLGARVDPVRRLQAVRLRPGARPPRPRGLLRGQERVRLDGIAGSGTDALDVFAGDRHCLVEHRARTHRWPGGGLELRRAGAG